MKTNTTLLTLSALVIVALAVSGWTPMASATKENKPVSQGYSVNPFVDPDTGVNYLCYGTSIIPRLNTNGAVLITPKK